MLTTTIFNNLVDDLFTAPISSYDTNRNDLVKYDDRYELIMEAAGVGKKDIDLQVDKRTLSVGFERKKYYDDSGTLLNYSNMQQGKVKKNFYLPDDVDISKITATCKDGILIVKIPKTSESTTKKISVT